MAEGLAVVKIALVQSYPFEGFYGGDASYIAQLRRFLLSKGHNVDTLVSNITRHRSNPLVRFRYSIPSKNHRWRVRGSIALGTDTFLSLSPGLYWRAFRWVLSKQPKYDQAYTEAEATWLERKLAQGGYDVIILLFEAVRYAALRLDERRRVIALYGFIQDQKMSLDQQLQTKIQLPHEILDVLAKADLIAVNSRAGLAAFSSLVDPDKLILVGMSYPRHRVAPPSKEPCVLFVGALQTPNVKSLKWFVSQIWPKILARHPTARFRVVGTVGRALAKEEHSNVDIVGVVKAIDEEYARTQIVVAPLIEGSPGLKTKVVEALSYGRPVVTTSIGVDPSERMQFGEAVDVADTPELFAEAVNRLLAEPGLRLHRASLVTQAFEHDFSDEAAYGSLAKRMDL
jgi:glycosyltransferase involved in cell wall biosynthesis